MTETSARSWLSRRLQKLTADDQAIDAQALQSDVATSGCAPVSACRKGEVVTVTGRLKSVVYTPRETVPTLEAELFDGSGSVTAVLIVLGIVHLRLCLSRSSSWRPARKLAPT